MREVLKTCSFAACGLIAGWAFGEPSGDRPDATHAWAVHDVNRPDPVKVSAEPGLPPSDAIVLFDGTRESIERHWRGKDGAPTKWTLRDGAFVGTPGSGNVFTAEEFGDCQLHVEWMTPVDDVEGWGNSGVFLMGVYEIQILDSSAIVPSRSPWKPANYADGQAGAVYGQNPPLANPTRKPGEWQSFDVVFHPPRREGKRLVDPGRITVFQNGVLVQDNWKLEGVTHWCRRAYEIPEKATGPVGLQDHGHPVAFRNIWIRRIPSPYDDTTGGGVGTKQGDVAELRHRLAAESLAFAEATDDPAERYIRLWESYCYEPDRKVKAKLGPAADAVEAAIGAGDARVTEMRHFGALKRFVKMLVLGGWIEKGTSLEKAIDGWKAPPKPTAPNLRDI